MSWSTCLVTAANAARWVGRRARGGCDVCTTDAELCRTSGNCLSVHHSRHAQLLVVLTSVMWGVVGCGCCGMLTTQRTAQGL